MWFFRYVLKNFALITISDNKWKYTPSNLQQVDTNQRFFRKELCGQKLFIWTNGALLQWVFAVWFLWGVKVMSESLKTWRTAIKLCLSCMQECFLLHTETDSITQLLWLPGSRFTEGLFYSLWAFPVNVGTRLEMLLFEIFGMLECEQRFIPSAFNEITPKLAIWKWNVVKPVWLLSQNVKVQIM